MNKCTFWSLKKKANYVFETMSCSELVSSNYTLVYLHSNKLIFKTNKLIKVSSASLGLFALLHAPLSPVAVFSLTSHLWKGMTHWAPTLSSTPQKLALSPFVKLIFIPGSLPLFVLLSLSFSITHPWAVSSMQLVPA